MNNVSCNKHQLVADSPPCIPVQPTSLWWWECNRSWQHPSTKEASLLITKPWETSQGRFWSEGKSGLGNPGPQINLVVLLDLQCLWQRRALALGPCSKQNLAKLFPHNGLKQIGRIQRNEEKQYFPSHL